MPLAKDSDYRYLSLRRNLAIARDELTLVLSSLKRSEGSRSIVSTLYEHNLEQEVEAIAYRYKDALSDYLQFAMESNRRAPHATRVALLVDPFHDPLKPRVPMEFTPA